MQRPTALSLFLCDQVSVDRDTLKPSLFGLFESVRCSQFPSNPKPFDVYAVLTDGQGRITIDVLVLSMTTEEQIDAQSAEINFPDPLHRQQVRFRFNNVSFPAPGPYIVELLAEGEVICHRRLEVRPG